jgi:oligopeptide/dipeptide ABC transporter ATP-binding protein
MRSDHQVVPESRDRAQPRRPIRGSLLNIEHLSVVFGDRTGRVPAVQDVTWSVDHGEVVGLVGESGSGKSVTALSLLGLLPDSADVTGRALLNDVDLSTLSAKEMQRLRGSQIGMVFQDPLSSLDPTMRIGPQLVESLTVHRRVSRRDARIRAMEMLELVGIPDPARRLKQYPHELSGGMRQRVMIGAALIAEPELLIADEPTTALDVTIQAQIIELLGRLRRELGMSIILITHDLGVVAGLADRINVMYAGRLVETGPARDVLRTPQHPYTRALISSVPRIDRLDAELRPIAGSPPSSSAIPSGCPFWPRCPEAMPRCREEMPPLYSIGPTHVAACLLHDRDEGAAA